MNSNNLLTRCISCKQELPPDSQVCGFGGAKLADRDEQELCPGCGNATVAGERFCGYCGVAISQQPNKELSLVQAEPSNEIEPPHFGYEQSEPDKQKTKLILIASACFLLLIVGLFLFARHSKSPQPNLSLDASGNPSQSNLPSSRILTKNPEFMKFLHPPTDDNLLEQSAAYRAKKNEIDSKLRSIQDPDLRKRLADEEWAKVNVDEYKRQATIAQLNNISSGLRTFLEVHRNDWFEIGHPSFSGTNSLGVTSVEASPITLSDGAEISIDVGTMDDIYSKFRGVASAQIEQQGRNWVDEQSCQTRLRNACKNLGGSESECADPAKLNEIVQTLGGSGILGDCNDNASIEEGTRLAETRMRSDRIVLIGQGDLLSHRIEKLLVVDYDTETVLHEFAPNALKADYSWKYPDEKNKGQFSSSSYRAGTDSLQGQEFGVVPIRSNERIPEKEISYNNPSESQPVPIEITLQGDSNGDFELDNGCSSEPLYPNGNCTVKVTFRPKSLGLHTATLSESDGSNSQISVLRGFGAWPWDIYRGEASSSTIPTDTAQPAASTAIDSEIRDVVVGWTAAYRARDAAKVAGYYSLEVEQYFRKKNVSRSQVQMYFESGFGKIENIRQYEISDIKTDVLHGANRATATYNKQWEVSQTDGKTFSGEEVERLTFARTDEGWKIVREDELNIIRATRQ